MMGWRYLVVMLTGAALAGGAAWSWQGQRIEVLQADQRAAHARIDELQGANGQCSADVATAKSAVAELVRLDAKRSAIAHAAVDAAQARAGAAAARAQDLQRRPPADPANACRSISDLRQDYMKGRAGR